ncbi:MAG: FAD-dependent monooxygenase [Woeseiaceae bacterium]|nr:FAD-dependent monooxygenase [Woeseiaceae bacterium]
MAATEVPILIVGGGAAGTMLSLELARRGVQARTVDKAAAPGDTSRALVVHARTAEILERIDENLIARYVERAIHNKGYVLHFVDGNGKRSEVRPGLDFTKLDCRYPYMLIHGQCDTENNIRDLMREQFDFEIEWGTKCTDVAQENGEVIATLSKGDGEETVRCQYLIACDGINSRVRETLELTQEESDYSGTVLQNMDVFLNDFPDVDDYVHYCAGTDHFIMVVKLPGGFYRLLLSDRGEAADPNIEPARAFMNLVDRHFDGVSLGDLVWHSKWESWVRLVDTYREGNVILAGDSAHVHSTTGGQGMNCCMQDAYNLGWKLALVMNGLARPELLDTYETERRPIAEQVIWAASSLHEIFMGHGKDIAERAKRINDPEFLDAVVGRCSGIAYTYRDYVEQPADLAPLEGPQIGDRAPDADLVDGGTLFGLTRHTGYTLLALPGSDGDGRATKASIDSLRDRFASVLHCHRLESSADLTRYYGSDPQDRLFLIRPDGYVGYRCRISEAYRLVSHLGEYLLQK